METLERALLCTENFSIDRVSHTRDWYLVGDLCMGHLYIEETTTNSMCSGSGAGYSLTRAHSVMEILNRSPMDEVKSALESRLFDVFRESA
ncbi:MULTISPECIES: hypothetical protein [Pseudovibrio]|uniref:hypothetical protein n=1 Tax=Stappiaceae TaxID=2821832 RepID=UPI0023663F95|nr:MULTISPECIES: hypothetical protein [Pseudovibrio]MDD7911676.1 hypothetical protein [Pseudovibrio exalbescens]MDX5594409.1 hypothetical protein [Pseudovibrio sp. SPO723]